MLVKTSLGPNRTTPKGAPRTRLLSKVQSALGSLRAVIRWARASIAQCYHLSRKSAAKMSVSRLGAIPKSVLYALDSSSSCMRKIGRMVREHQDLQDLPPPGPRPHRPGTPPPPTSQRSYDYTTQCKH